MKILNKIQVKGVIGDPSSVDGALTLPTNTQIGATTINQGAAVTVNLPAVAGTLLTEQALADTQLTGTPTVNGHNIATTTTASINYYVATTGSDLNDGSVGSPFLTIGHAISKIPKILRHTATVTVAAGTYNENVIIDGFTGIQKLSLLGGSDSVTAVNYIVNRITLENNTVEIYVRGFLATSTSWHSFDVSNCTKFSFYSCVTTVAAAAYQGFNIASSNGYIYDCVAGNKSKALKSYSNSNVFSYSWDAGSTGNTTGLYASEGGTIYRSGGQPTGTTAMSVEFAGVITGAVLDPISTTDPRLSDARTPLAHAHAISDVTGLQTTLTNIELTAIAMAIALG